MLPRTHLLPACKLALSATLLCLALLSQSAQAQNNPRPAAVPGASATSSNSPALEASAKGVEVWSDMIEISNGDSVTTVLVLTGDAAGLEHWRKPVEAMLSGLTIAAPAKVAATSAPAGTTVTAAELVGLWRHGEGGELDYVNGTGAYAGSQSVLYGESWDLHADMTYEGSFDGTSSIIGQAHTKSGGTWALEGSKIVFSPKGSARQGYWFLSIEQKPNGSILHVLADRWKLDPGGLFYKEEWSRVKKK